MTSSTVSTANKIIGEDVRLIGEALSAQVDVLAGTTILVTGGSGFLCSYVLDTLAYLNDNVLHPQCRVVSVDNLRSGVADRVAHLARRPDFSFVNGDVSQ